jgi:hypothetical protein
MKRCYCPYVLCDQNLYETKNMYTRHPVYLSLHQSNPRVQSATTPSSFPLVMQQIHGCLVDPWIPAIKPSPCTWAVPWPRSTAKLADGCSAVPWPEPASELAARVVCCRTSPSLLPESPPGASIPDALCNHSRPSSSRHRHYVPGHR